MKYTPQIVRDIRESLQHAQGVDWATINRLLQKLIFHYEKEQADQYGKGYEDAANAFVAAFQNNPNVADYVAAFKEGFETRDRRGPHPDILKEEIALILDLYSGKGV